MSKVQINTVELEGFGSFIEPNSFDLNKIGLHLVKGANGSGKTTLFSAVCWAVYGVNLKGLTNASIVTWKQYRSANFIGTRVLVDLVVGDFTYYIGRHIKYKGKTAGLVGGDRLMIFKVPNGEALSDTYLLGEEQHKGDMQGYINNLLGIDSRAFVNSVVFGQRMARLVSAKPDDKRKLFEELFDMLFVQEGKDKAFKLAGEQSTLVAATEAAILTHTNNIITYKELEEKEQESIKERKEEQARELDEEKELIKLDEEQLAVMKKDLDTIKSTRAKLGDKPDLEEILAKEKKYQGIEKEAISNVISAESEVRSIDESIEASNKSIAKMQAKVLALEAEKQLALEIKDLKAKVKAKRPSAEVAIEALKKAKEELTKLKGNTEAIEKDISVTGRLVETYRNDITKLNKELDNVADTCPTCLQPLKKSEVEKVKVALNIKLNDIHAQLNECTKGDARRAKALKAAEVAQQAQEATVSKLEDERDNVYERIGTYDLHLKTLENKEATLKASVDEAAEIMKEVTLANKLPIKLAEAKATLEEDKEVREKVTKALEKVTADKEAKTKLRDEITTLEKTIAFQEGTIKSKEELIQSRKASIEKIKARVIKPSQDFLTKILEERSALEELVPQLQKQTTRLTNLRWWNDVGFSASGMKTYIFSAMLNRVNEQAKKYADRLGFGVEFSVDLDKASKPFVTKCYKGGMPLEYEALSGGQQQRLDICLAFAMHDVVGVKSSFNILIMDEIFEGLDKEGIEVAFDLIRVKAGEGRAVYVITHLDSVDAMGSKTLTFSLDSNNNTIIE